MPSDAFTTGQFEIAATAGPFLLPVSPIRRLDAYRDSGGLLGLRNAGASGPEATISWISEAGLRGRGGAGFPTCRRRRAIS